MEIASAMGNVLESGSGLQMMAIFFTALNSNKLCSYPIERTAGNLALFYGDRTVIVLAPLYE